MASRISYGKACTNCARLKYKCVYRGDGQPCERCQRLSKSCEASTSVRKRNSKLLSVSQSTQIPTENKNAHLQDDVLIQTDHNLLFPASFGQQLPGHDALGDINGSGAILTPHSITHTDVCIARDAVVRLPSLDAHFHAVSEQDATNCLKTFRQWFLPNFPFVNIPPYAQAEDLRRQVPFLWLVILSLTSKSSALQMSMGDSIRSLIAAKVIKEEERTMDFLLGLICHIAWIHVHPKSKPSLTMLMQIVVSLYYELKLQKAFSPLNEDDNTAPLSSNYVCFTQQRPSGKKRTFEERRATLAVWLTSSFVSNGTRQMESIRWTPYIESCLRFIEESMQSDQDALLILQVKCHRIMDQVTRALVEHDDTAEPIPTYFVKAVLPQLQELRDNLPEVLCANTTALLYLQSTEILIREAALKSRSERTITVPLPGLARLNALEALFVSIKGYYTIHDSMPVAPRLGTSFHMASQYAHAMILLFRLSTLDERGWDTAQVKLRLDLLETLDCTASAQAQVPTIHGFVNDGESGGLFQAPSMLAIIKLRFMNEMERLERAKNRASMEERVDNSWTQGHAQMSDDDQVERFFADDPLFAEMFFQSTF